MIILPADINGTIARVIRANFQLKNNDIPTPINMPPNASIIVAICSVVSPFKQLISSERRLLKIPGARFLSSNHDIYLSIIEAKSSFLMLLVRFSPIILKTSLLLKAETATTTASSANIPIQNLLVSSKSGL